MTRWARWITPILAVFALLSVGFSTAESSAKSPTVDEDPASQSIADQVIVVGIAGLRWEDVNRNDAPTLTRLTQRGSAGTLSVRSVPSVTCPGEGWLTLGAGTYSAIVRPKEIEQSAGCAPRQPPPVSTEDSPQAPEMPALRQLNDDLRFDAKPGLLGQMLPCTAAVGPGAVLAAANPEGYVTRYQESLPPDATALLRQCPLTAVDLGEVAGEDVQRPQQVRQVDALLAQIQRDRPARSVLLVVGVAETESVQPRLHVVAADGPTFGFGWLHSPSTRRLPYVQLADIAPTVLEVLGVPVPDEMAGRPLSGEADGRPATLRATLAELTDTDTQAVAQRSVVNAFFVGLGVSLLVVLGALAWLLRRRSQGKPVSATASRWWSLLAFGLAAVPTATFVANFVPWWRAKWPTLAVSGVVAAASLVMLAAATVASMWFRWPRRVSVRVSVLAGITLAVFFYDGLTGGWLQLNSLLGYNPLVAGRFVGFGNIAFAVLAISAVVFAAFVAYGQRRPIALGVLAAVAIPVILLDGLPQWGADFGGVITLVPSFVVLGLLLTRARITWGRVVLATAGGLALVLLIGWLDYLRPESSRSHFGRFIAGVIDGSAVATVRRKMLTSFDLLLMGPHTIIAALLMVALIVMVFRPPTSLWDTYHQLPVVRVALVASVVLALFGFATNDSGVAIPSVMALVAVPLTFALCVTVKFRGEPSVQ